MAVPTLGFACVPYLPPERLRELAVAAETAGLDELWVWEDCFKQSGLASAAAALAWTERIAVGIGLMPTPLRSVAVTAMEIATLERMFPGRFIPGIGHGVQSWMAQTGHRAASPLTLLREYVTSTRELLGGATVSTQGRYVTLDAVALDWPPVQPPALAVGGVGPRSVELAAEVGDVFLLSACRSEAEIAETRRAVDAVRERTHPGAPPMPMVATQVAATGRAAADRAAAESARWATDGVTADVLAGDADAIAAGIRRLAGLGITSVVIQPTADETDHAGLMELVAGPVRDRLVGAA